MISHFRVENYKGLREVELDLTPIHVLIGPNDSGKSSILQALETYVRSATEPLVSMFEEAGQGLVWQRQPSSHVRFDGTIRTIEGAVLGYDLLLRPCPAPHYLSLARERWIGTDGVPLVWEIPPTVVCATALEKGMVGYEPQLPEELRSALRESIGRVQTVQWVPRMLAQPVASSFPPRINRGGFGLAAVLDDMAGSHRKSLSALEADFRSIFPRVDSIRLPRGRGFVQPPALESANAEGEVSDGKSLEISFVGVDDAVTAPQLSDGMLLILGFLTLVHMPNPASLILVEEPENGLHPSRLAEIVRLLRRLTEEKHTQIILTTHSPYLLDHFLPEEVTLCRMDPEVGVQTTRLSESEGVKEYLDAFTLGEIWTGEGDDALSGVAAGGALG